MATTPQFEIGQKVKLIKDRCKNWENLNSYPDILTVKDVFTSFDLIIYEFEEIDDRIAEFYFSPVDEYIDPEIHKSIVDFYLNNEKIFLTRLPYTEQFVTILLNIIFLSKTYNIGPVIKSIKPLNISIKDSIVTEVKAIAQTILMFSTEDGNTYDYSWISREDLLRIILFLINESSD